MRCDRPIGQPFFELSEVDSSNNYAMRMIQAHLAEHGTTWFAHYQNAGKGQRGKQWNAAAGQNIMMSCVLKTNTLSIDNQFTLNIAIALACYDLFNKYAVEKTFIKWPNDIYWKDRKAGGILIENILKGEMWKFAVVGMGININQTLFHNDIKRPVSLKQITGKTFDIILLAKELCECLEIRWRQLLSGSNNEMLEEYNSHLFKRNEHVAFKKDNATFTATVVGVNKKGELIIKTNEYITIAHGSVEWIIPS